MCVRRHLGGLWHQRGQDWRPRQHARPQTSGACLTGRFWNVAKMGEWATGNCQIMPPML